MLGLRSSSRTHPPAHSASKPAARSFSTISRANSRCRSGWGMEERGRGRGLGARVSVQAAEAVYRPAHHFDAAAAGVVVPGQGVLHARPQEVEHQLGRRASQRHPARPVKPSDES